MKKTPQAPKETREQHFVLAEKVSADDKYWLRECAAHILGTLEAALYNANQQRPQADLEARAIVAEADFAAKPQPTRMAATTPIRWAAGTNPNVGVSQQDATKPSEAPVPTAGPSQTAPDNVYSLAGARDQVSESLDRPGEVTSAPSFRRVEQSAFTDGKQKLGDVITFPDRSQPTSSPEVSIPEQAVDQLPDRDEIDRTLAEIYEQQEAA